MTTANPPAYPSSTSALRGLCLGLIALALTPTHAEPPPSARTGLVGFTSLVLNPGYNAVAISLLNLDVIRGRIANPDGVSGNVVMTTSTGVNLGAALKASKQYYLEVVGESVNNLGYVGERFEVDVAATIASANATITLKTSSPTNTISPVPDLSDYGFVVREHVTMAQVFGGTGNVKLSGSGLASSSDQVLFFDNATGGFTTYWFRANAQATDVSWRSTTDGDTTDYSNMAIRPGIGLFVYRQPSAGAITLTMAGAVRNTAFRNPLPAGYTLISPPAPMKHSPAVANMVAANGWKGSGSASAADQVHVWTGRAFDAYWFRANTTGTIQEWRNTNDADSANHMNDALFPSGKAIFVRKLQPDPEYIVNP